MSNPIKCPCDCPASILDKQNYEKYHLATDNNECVPVHQNEKKCEHNTNNNECVTDNNECTSNNQIYKCNDNDCNNKCILYNQHQNNNKTQRVPGYDERVPDKQSNETSRLLADYSECLSKLQEIEKRLKFNENTTKTVPQIETYSKSVVSQKKDEDLNKGKSISIQDYVQMHENKKCLKVIQERLTRLYDSKDQKYLKEKRCKCQDSTPRKPEKLERHKQRPDKLEVQKYNNQDELKTHQDTLSTAILSKKSNDQGKLKSKQDVSSPSNSNVKRHSQDKLKIQQNPSPPTTSSIKSHEQDEFKIEANSSPPAKSSSSTFKECISNACSKFFKSFKDFDKSITSDKNKNNSPASSELSSNSTTGSRKSSKSSDSTETSVSTKSSKSNKSNKSPDSDSKQPKAKDKVIILSRAQKKFYEYEKPSPKSDKASTKNDKCNTNCNCCKKSWW